MTITTFAETLPDYKDIDNRTGRCPGYQARIWHDGETVGLAFMPVGSDNPMEESGVALTVEQAVELRAALQDAISACKKN
jgi:hypothetical protein